MCASLVHSQGMVWLLDPNEPFAGHVEDGGRIVARVSPGCWGAMITPDYHSGHEVTRPIAVEGAEPGDAVILRIRKINVLSLATTSGTDAPQEGHFDGDPFVAKKCPSCGEVNPQTYVEGIGEDAVRCKKCGTPVHPFKIENGYTLLMDENREIGITVNKEAAEEIAKDAASFSAIPQGSCQYSANLFAKADLPGVIAPLRPMVGNIGSCPAVRMPASHNAGDFGSFLVGAPHAYALDEEDLEKRTDGHMDVNEVVEGTALVVPVKVPGAGIYVGDVHAMMGDGEIAGHTTDVSAEVIIDVELIKGLLLEGPMLLPLEEDLPKIASIRFPEEIEVARSLASRYGFALEEETLPIQVIGSGKDLNAATANGLKRMASFTGLPLPEIKNRCTITGQVEIGRLPGVVQVTMLVPKGILEKRNLWETVLAHYEEF